MATFQAQVEGLTGITVSTTPTTGELTEFLRDGVIDVTNRWLAVKPQDVENFLRTTSSDSQGVSVGGAKIVYVMREAGATGASDGSTAWRACRKIPSALQSRVVDESSLHFASQYNPAYIIENDHTINVYPVPSANNGMKVFTNNTNLAFSHSNIKYFPNDKVYLVVLYAAIKTLQAKMSEYVTDEEDLELEQGIGLRVTDLQKQYDAAFVIHQAQQQQQQQQQRGR